LALGAAPRPQTGALTGGQEGARVVLLVPAVGGGRCRGLGGVQLDKRAHRRRHPGRHGARRFPGTWRPQRRGGAPALLHAHVARRLSGPWPTGQVDHAPRRRGSGRPGGRRRQHRPGAGAAPVAATVICATAGTAACSFPSGRHPGGGESVGGVSPSPLSVLPLSPCIKAAVLGRALAARAEGCRVPASAPRQGRSPSGPARCPARWSAHPQRRPGAPR
jgi:hypothetical protein